MPQDSAFSDLEQGIGPRMKPWKAEHAAAKISMPLRHNRTPYRGMNILLLWGEAMAKGYAAPIWMTFKQAIELNAHVRKRRMVPSLFTPTASPRPRRTIRARTWALRIRDTTIDLSILHI